MSDKTPQVKLIVDGRAVWLPLPSGDSLFGFPVFYGRLSESPIRHIEISGEWDTTQNTDAAFLRSLGIAPLD